MTDHKAEWVERMLGACVPGGSYCDPQRVADAIREYYAVRAAAPAASEGEDGAVALLEALLAHVDAETCTHEETHRGGAIWTICDGCGRQWADDRGGFKPHEDAPAVAAARAFLDRPAAQVAATPKHDEGRIAVCSNMGDSEANFIADGERLNCPACGGSGHIDDAIATQPAARRVTDEDENGEPVGYARWYCRRFRGQVVDTQRDALCEEAWRAALESFAQPAEGVSGG